MVTVIASNITQAKVTRKSSQYRRFVAVQRACIRVGKKKNDKPVSAQIVLWETLVSTHR